MTLQGEKRNCNLCQATDLAVTLSTNRQSNMRRDTHETDVSIANGKVPLNFRPVSFLSLSYLYWYARTVCEDSSHSKLSTNLHLDARHTSGM